MAKGSGAPSARCKCLTMPHSEASPTVRLSGRWPGGSPTGRLSGRWPAGEDLGWPNLQPKPSTHSCDGLVRACSDLGRMLMISGFASPRSFSKSWTSSVVCSLARRNSTEVAVGRSSLVRTWRDLEPKLKPVWSFWSKSTWVGRWQEPNVVTVTRCPPVPCSTAHTESQRCKTAPLAPLPRAVDPGAVVKFQRSNRSNRLRQRRSSIHSHVLYSLFWVCKQH